MEKTNSNKRVCAILIDILIITIINAILIEAFNLSPHNKLLVLVNALFYFFRDSIKGQSPGKLLVCLKVVGQRKHPISFMDSFKRNIILFWYHLVFLFISRPSPPVTNEITIPQMLIFGSFIITIIIHIIEYVAATGSKDGRRFGDKIAGTTVVDLKPERPAWIFALVGLCALLLLIYIGSQIM